MSRLRMVIAMGLVVGATATTFVAGPATGQINAQVQSSAPSWVVSLLIKDPLSGKHGCSGQLVANGWVLTAAHCVTFSSGAQATPSSITALVGTATATGTDTHTAIKVVRSPTYVSGKAGDVALIQLGKFNGANYDALPLAFESGVVNRPGGVTFYSYGARTTSTSPGPLNPLQKSPDGAFTRQPSCDNINKTLFACYQPTSTKTVGSGAPSLQHGDSGSAALVWQSGAWQIQAVADTVAYNPLSTRPAPRIGATSVLSSGGGSYATIRNWVWSVTGIPQMAAGTIVRNSANGNSWLVQPDGYRNWIHDGGTYQCLIAQGHPVMNLLQITIDAVPDRVGAWASAICGSTPPTTYPEQEGSHGANTFLDYHNASGMGPAVAAAQWVNVSCKVYDPYIASVNPDGYWYRLADSPWNNQYYAAANTFMNGDPWGGPYTHNTDFNVPNC